MIETVFAAAGLLVCAALLLRMALPRERQARWDRFWRRRLDGLRVAGRWTQRQWRLLRASRGARRSAAQAIERVKKRTAVDRDGNVIRPHGFGQGDSKKKPPLH